MDPNIVYFLHVIEERWGPSGHLAASISAQGAAPSHVHLHSTRARRGQLKISESVAGDEAERGKKGVEHASHDYLRIVTSEHSEVRKPKQDSLHWKENKKQNTSEDSLLISFAISGINRFSNDGSFMESISRLHNEDAKISSSFHEHREETTNLRKKNGRSDLFG